ncbi:MAG TPA: DmsC/YnfH family molybdoenzyme membrane anchor subunit [Candidatus Bathyarchaeia archaeon]|nr:DmsC/YnfH family molybdoenzyme membrane anchor subunit [Candidatus Bathyarchaeia archaeon]
MSSAVTAYVVFTVFTQMSVGALIAMLIADFLAKSKEDAKFFETGAWICVPVAAIGLIGILSHEARPIQAMFTMTKNVSSSLLSQEVLVLTIFVILAVIYTAMWLLEPEYGSLKGFPVIPSIVGKLMPLRKPVGVLAAVVGLAFPYISAAAYMIYTLPSLNQPTTILFFYVTALLAGVTAVAAVLSVKYTMKKEGDEPLARMLWITMGIALVMVIVLAVGLILNTGMLEVAETEYAQVAQHETLSMLSGEYSTLYMARWVIGVGLALICTIALALPLKKKSMATASMIAIVLFIVVLIGELMGRTVMFGTNVPLGDVLPNIEAFYTALGPAI